ncbi:MAG: DUF721 domain-containing protein [Candidatus Paceibacteria bacterium]
MSVTPLGDALEEKIDDESTLKQQIDASKVVEIAQKVLEDMFGSEQAVHANPQYLKNRTLTITCSSSTMAQEIRLNQDKIVEKINQKLGTDKVDTIRYLS